LIAGSTSITVNGTINANGGAGGNSGGNTSADGCGCFGVGYGGGGSGGGIRLVTNTITGAGTLTASGGSGQSYTPNCAGYNSGGNGVLRIEALYASFTGKLYGTLSTGTPDGAFLLLPTAPPPSISVQSVNNTQLPQPPTGGLTTPDVTINTSSAVTITVQASYIPVGTIITLNVFSDNGTNQTVQTTPLTGTLQSSTATATMTFPSGYSLNYVKATWTH